MKGGSRQGRQRKRWEDNIREWTGLEFAKSQRAVENREKWRKLVAKSFMVLQRPSRLGIDDDDDENNRMLLKKDVYIENLPAVLDCPVKFVFNFSCVLIHFAATFYLSFHYFHFHGIKAV